MPDTIQNWNYWKDSTDIDYITHFIKVWIAFNAWYQTHITGCTSEREYLNNVKTGSNPFRNKFINFLQGNGKNAQLFQVQISSLCYNLEAEPIDNEGERIAFDKIVVEVNRNNSFQREERGIKYFVQADIKNSITVTRVISTVKDGNGNDKFVLSQNSYDIDGLLSNQNFIRNLSTPQQTILRSGYESVNPRIPINLKDPDGKTLGSINFIDDNDKICKGVIEILYNLRNVLFHGNIAPEKAKQKVYEPAYHILKLLIDEIG